MTGLFRRLLRGLRLPAIFLLTLLTAGVFDLALAPPAAEAQSRVERARQARARRARARRARAQRGGQGGGGARRATRRPARPRPRAAQSEEAVEPNGMRLIVERISGPRGRPLQRILERSLQDRGGYEIVRSLDISRARRRLHLPSRGDLEAGEMAELARELDVTAIIRGQAAHRGGRWSLEVELINGNDGQVLGTAEWRERTTARLQSDIRDNGFANLETDLGRAMSPVARASAPVDTSMDSELPPGQASGEDEEEPDEPDEPREPSTRYDAIRIAVTGGTLYRWMNTSAQVYTVRRGGSATDPASSFIDEERGYQSGGVGHFELGVEAEFYPGAFEEQAFPYLGLLISYRNSIGVNTFGCRARTACNGDDLVSIPTNQNEFLAALKARIRFGEQRREPELAFEAGYGFFNFDLGIDELQLIELDTIIPPFQYSGYVHLGAAFTYGIVPDYFIFSLHFAYRVGVAMGAETRAVWGTDTTPANGLTAGLEIRHEMPYLAQGAFLALRAEFFQFTTRFRGQVACANEPCTNAGQPWENNELWELWPVNPDNTSDLLDVAGGVHDDVNDNYVRVALYAGWAFY